MQDPSTELSNSPRKPNQNIRYNNAKNPAIGHADPAGIAGEVSLKMLCLEYSNHFCWFYRAVNDFRHPSQSNVPGEGELMQLAMLHAVSGSLPGLMLNVEPAAKILREHPLPVFPMSSTLDTWVSGVGLKR